MCSTRHYPKFWCKLKSYLILHMGKCGVKIALNGSLTNQVRSNVGKLKLAYSCLGFLAQVLT